MTGVGCIDSGPRGLGGQGAATFEQTAGWVRLRGSMPWQRGGKVPLAGPLSLRSLQVGHGMRYGVEELEGDPWLPENVGPRPRGPPVARRRRPGCGSSEIPYGRVSRVQGRAGWS